MHQLQGRERPDDSLGMPLRDGRWQEERSGAVTMPGLPLCPLDFHPFGRGKEKAEARISALRLFCFLSDDLSLR
ncbi:MAG: hypothetical protein ABS58_13275 [Mesorhizobium sp. SCN 65-20]|nr:MAG: hypothetical protein ABS58_13275 [Mesorhizobium sp. SCN 65-20]